MEQDRTDLNLKCTGGLTRAVSYGGLGGWLVLVVAVFVVAVVVVLF